MTVRYRSATLGEFIEHHSHDVSRGGMFIKTPAPFPPGTLLKFEVKIADEQRVMQGVGRVVWKREESEAAAATPAGMGIKFIKIDDASQSVIERLVDSRNTEEKGAFDERPVRDSKRMFPDLGTSSIPPPAGAVDLRPSRPPVDEEAPLPPGVAALADGRAEDRPAKERAGKESANKDEAGKEGVGSKARQPGAQSEAGDRGPTSPASASKSGAQGSGEKPSRRGALWAVLILAVVLGLYFMSRSGDDNSGESGLGENDAAAADGSQAPGETQVAQPEQALPEPEGAGEPGAPSDEATEAAGEPDVASEPDDVPVMLRGADPDTEAAGAIPAPGVSGDETTAPSTPASSKDGARGATAPGAPVAR